MISLKMAYWIQNGRGREGGKGLQRGCGMLVKGGVAGGARAIDTDRSLDFGSSETKLCSCLVSLPPCHGATVRRRCQLKQLKQSARCRSCGHGFGRSQESDRLSCKVSNLFKHRSNETEVGLESFGCASRQSRRRLPSG